MVTRQRQVLEFMTTTPGTMTPAVPVLYWRCTTGAGAPARTYVLGVLHVLKQTCAECRHHKPIIQYQRCRQRQRGLPCRWVRQLDEALGPGLEGSAVLARLLGRGAGFWSISCGVQGGVALQPLHDQVDCTQALQTTSRCKTACRREQTLISVTTLIYKTYYLLGYCPRLE